MRRLLACLALILTATAIAPAARADHVDCGRRICPHVEAGPGTFTAADVYMENGGWVASNIVPPEPRYTYQLSHPCVVDDRENGACRGSDFRICPAAPGRVVEDLVIERKRLVITADTPGGGTTTDDGFDPEDNAVGTPVGPWIPGERGCVDITALNPPPSPAEIYRYFQTLPLPQLTTQHQPPGNGLVGLPVIFYTDGATAQTFDLTIRGFQVQIVAGATSFTWHTGDGTELTSTTPGAPYPDHTISHDYRSGTYTAYLTVTWGATFSVNGGPSVAVPDTTTTDGPPVTFTVLQARPVLTNPYD